MSKAYQKCFVFHGFRIHPKWEPMSTAAMPVVAGYSRATNRGLNAARNSAAPHTYATPAKMPARWPMKEAFGTSSWMMRSSDHALRSKRLATPSLFTSTLRAKMTEEKPTAHWSR